MSTIAAFVVLVFLYSLVSRRLEHTVITAPIVFTATGMLLVLSIPGLHDLTMQRETFLELAELGLVMLLFADAAHIDLQTVQSRERLPLRLLSIGMLLTILLGAIAGHLIFPQLSLWEAGILAAILAPTDAGLGQVIVHSPRVPLRIRQALDVEAGLNDGLSVPFLMFFIAVAQIGTEGAGRILLTYVVEQLGMGALVGGAIGLAGGWLLGKARRQEWMAASVQQLGLVTLPILSILACEPIGGSMFIAAYVAGIAVQVGFRDVSALSVAFIDGWGQLFDYFVFFLYLTVSLLMNPLVYCHIKSFQRAASVEKPWPGGEKRRDGRASHHEAWGAMESFLLPCVATGVSLRAVWCLIGATPGGQPWTSAVTLPQGRNGLSARRMAVLSTFRALSLCHQVHRE
jgi:NhaP-type Na+/H+ or K+/H+ antiporter